MSRRNRPGTDGTDGSFTFGSSGRDRCDGGCASFPPIHGRGSYGPDTPQLETAARSPEQTSPT